MNQRNARPFRTESGFSDTSHLLKGFRRLRRLVLGRPESSRAAGTSTSSPVSTPFVGAVILGAILGCSLGFAGQVSSRDGSYWHSLLPSGRIAYIEGYTDAMYITAKKLETLDAATRTLHWKGAKKIFGLVTSELDFSGHTADDLM